MHRLSHFAAAGFILLGLGTRPARAQAAGDTTARAASVKDAELARRQALLASDTVALSRLVAPEFYEVSRFGQIRPRSANMREIATGALHLLTVNYDSTVVHVYGDVAVLSAIADNTGTYMGMPFSGKIRYTRVFVWRDDRWQAVVMQQTPLQ